MKVLIIIPCYNEEKNIIETVESIKKTNYDYVVINDGSTDNSLEVIKKNGFNYVNLNSNVGIGAAMQTGYKYAKNNNYDVAIQFDGDGQHEISYIDNLINPIIKKEASLVIGSRFVGQESTFKSTKLRRIGIKLLSFMLKRFTNYEIKDITSGFRAADREIIEVFSKKYPYEYPEPITNLFLARRKYKIKEIPVKMKERKNGTSSITKLKSVYYMINVILYFMIIRFSKGENKDA